MFIAMILIFVLGYTAIALEHPLKVDKAASALFIGVAMWSLYILNSSDILTLGLSPSWEGLKEKIFNAEFQNHFVVHELRHHIIEIAEILFFLLGAMTIVEVVDQHNGFRIITEKITTTNPIKLLWILCIITFFMSAVLDNLTTTIVLLALLKKLIRGKKIRWMFAGMVVISANAGGAWSPIGDVTTIMLWVGGQVTAASIIKGIIIPSMITILVPLIILSFTLKTKIYRPSVVSNSDNYSTPKEQTIILIIGLASLLFVPVFKTITHLPPFMGMLGGLSVLWIITEIMHANKPAEIKRILRITYILRRIEMPTIFFFMGILAAVAALQSAGHLAQLAQWLDTATNNNIFIINIAIGVLSSIVDNVPLVAGAMGMYNISDIGVYAVDGTFWHFLAYCAGTGGSILIIGSAAGVAAMGIEKIDFIWYIRNISLLAFAGYIAGAGVYLLLV